MCALNMNPNVCTVPLFLSQTFPALLDLYRHDFLPKFVTICGYSRSKMTDEDLRKRIRPYLTKKGSEADAVVEEFLERVHYRSGRSTWNINIAPYLASVMLLNL